MASACAVRLSPSVQNRNWNWNSCAGRGQNLKVCPSAWQFTSTWYARVVCSLELRRGELSRGYTGRTASVDLATEPRPLTCTRPRTSIQRPRETADLPAAMGLSKKRQSYPVSDIFNPNRHLPHPPTSERCSDFQKSSVIVDHPFGNQFHFFFFFIVLVVVVESMQLTKRVSLSLSLSLSLSPPPPSLSLSLSLSHSHSLSLSHLLSARWFGSEGLSEHFFMLCFTLPVIDAVKLFPLSSWLFFLFLLLSSSYFADHRSCTLCS